MNDWFDAEQRVERAQQLFERRRWQEALSEIEAALEVNPDNSVWHFHRGNILDQMGRHGEAIEAYEASLRLDPNEPEVMVRQGVAMACVGRLTGAIEVFAKLTELKPDFEPGYCYQIPAYSELGQHDKAEEAFYLAQQLNADCPHCFYHIGISLMDRGELTRAIQCWQRVLSIDPEYENVHRQIGAAYRSLGDRDKASHFYTEAIRDDPGDAELLCEVAQYALEHGEHDDAGAKFRQAILLEPDLMDAHVGLAQLLLLQDKAAVALESLLKVKAADPEYEQLDLQLGAAYVKLGRLREASKCLRTSVVKHPDSREAHLMYGNCLLLRRRAAAAAEEFRRVIALDGKLSVAHHNLGVCHFMMGDHEGGIRHCLEAIELQPDHLVAIIKTIRGYQELGRFGEARAMIERGLEVDPDNAFLQQLGNRLWRVRLGHAVRRLKTRVRRVFGR